MNKDVKYLNKEYKYKGYETPGWYFIDEYRKYIYGPYKKEEDAISELEIHILTSNPIKKQ